MKIYNCAKNLHGGGTPYSEAGAQYLTDFCSSSPLAKNLHPTVHDYVGQKHKQEVQAGALGTLKTQTCSPEDAVCCGLGLKCLAIGPEYQQKSGTCSVYH